MSLLTKDYFFQNKGLALLGATCGIAIAALFGLGSHKVGFMLVWLVVQPLISGSFTLKTQASRLWCGAYIILLVCLVLVYLVRLPHPVAWIGLVLCAVCGILTTCLRRNPPPGLS